MNNSSGLVSLTSLFLLSHALAESEVIIDLGDPSVVIADAESLDGFILDRNELSSRQSLGTSFQEILPSIAGAFGGNPTSGLFSLRGLNLDGVSPGVGAVTNPLISVFENGVPLSTTTLRYLPSPSLGIDSLIVKKGPTNDIAGPASMGGALFFENSSPRFGNEGEFILQYSENSTISSYLTQNATLVKDELALRVSYYFFESDGDATAPVLEAIGNDDFSQYDRERLEAALLWHPGKNKDHSLQLNLLYDQSGGNPQANTAIIPGVQDLFDRVSNVNFVSSYPAERLSASLRGDFTLPGDITLSTVTAFQSVELEQNLDFDGGFQLDWFINGTTDENLFSQSIILSGDKGAWSWKAGGFYENNSYDVSFSGVGIAPFPTGSQFDNLGTTEVSTFALHGELERDLSEKFRASVGLRYQRDERDFDGSASFSILPATAVLADTNDDVFLPWVKLEYLASDETDIVFSFSRGHRAGGVSFAPIAGLATEYDAESSWDLELVATHEVSPELTLSAAVFYSEIEDQQVANTAVGGLPGVDVVFVNSGQSHRFGAEAEFAWKPVEELSFYGNAAWLKTEYDELTINGVDQAGQAFPNAPELSVAVGASYKHESGVFANIDYSWSDSTYSIVASPEETALEIRSLLNARIGWEGSNKKVYLFASNLLDDEYALYRGVALPPVIPQTGKAGPLRSFGIGFEYRW